MSRDFFSFLKENTAARAAYVDVVWLLRARVEEARNAESGAAFARINRDHPEFARAAVRRRDDAQDVLRLPARRREAKR